jgi:hypothetical protein
MQLSKAIHGKNNESSKDTRTADNEKHDQVDQLKNVKRSKRTRRNAVKNSGGQVFPSNGFRRGGLGD